MAGITLVFALLLCYPTKDKEGDTAQLLLLASAVSAFLLIIILSAVTLHFVALRNLVRNTSIISIFDNGYTTDIPGQQDRISFTTQCLKASISGIPVIMTIDPGGQRRKAELTFTFSPLTHALKGDGLQQTVKFGIGTDLPSTVEEIRPRLLAFIAGFTENGFCYLGEVKE